MMISDAGPVNHFLITTRRSRLFGHTARAVRHRIIHARASERLSTVFQWTSNTQEVNQDDPAFVLGLLSNSTSDNTTYASIQCKTDLGLFEMAQLVEMAMSVKGVLVPPNNDDDDDDDDNDEYTDNATIS